MAGVVDGADSFAVLPDRQETRQLSTAADAVPCRLAPEHAAWVTPHFALLRAAARPRSTARRPGHVLGHATVR